MTSLRVLAGWHTENAVQLLVEPGPPTPIVQANRVYAQATDRHALIPIADRARSPVLPHLQLASHKSIIV